MTSFRAAAVCSPKILFFAKFQNIKTNFLAAFLSTLLFYQRSFSLLSTQISEPRLGINQSNQHFSVAEV